MVHARNGCTRFEAGAAHAIGETVRDLRMRRDDTSQPSHLRRRATSFTQEAVAMRAGLGRATVADIETGRRHISVRDLLALAEALGVCPAELLEPPGGVEQVAVNARVVSKARFLLWLRALAPLSDSGDSSRERSGGFLPGEVLRALRRHDAVPVDAWERLIPALSEWMTDVAESQGAQAVALARRRLDVAITEYAERFAMRQPIEDEQGGES